jgi:hypothetical protein
MRGDICIHRITEGFRIDFLAPSENRSASGSGGEVTVFGSVGDAIRFLVNLGLDKRLARSHVELAQPTSTISGYELAHEDVELCFPLIWSDRVD